MLFPTAAVDIITMDRNRAAEAARVAANRVEQPPRSSRRRPVVSRLLAFTALR